MQTFREVIKLWPSYAALASELPGATYGQIQLWHHRDSIPGEWWEPIERAAERRGFDGVTLKALAELAARRKTARSRAA